MILERSHNLGRVPILLDVSNLFWLGPNLFGRVQIKLFYANFYNFDLSKMIWTRPKQIGPIQWFVVEQNDLNPYLEGQDTEVLFT